MSYFEKLDLERIDDTSLAEGKRVRYQSYRFTKPKLPRDYQSIRLDGAHYEYACGNHASIYVALLAEHLLIDSCLLSITSVSETDRRSGVKISHQLRCHLCEAQEEYVRLSSSPPAVVEGAMSRSLLLPIELKSRVHQG